MFQLSKRIEYGLIALRHMAKGQLGQTYSVKEIAVEYNLSYELLAKVMQKLAKSGLVVSHQGTRGGYVLFRHPASLSITSIIDAIESKGSMTLIQCSSESNECCSIQQTCTIKDPLSILQGNIHKVMSEMTVMELI